jgi:Cu/Ag efflux protein CusF
MKSKLLVGLFALILSTATAWAASEHEAAGVVKSIDKSAKTLKISHGPIKSMNMGAMTMDFLVADPAMLREVKPGQGIDFVVTTNRKGQFVVVDMVVNDAHASN